MPLSSAAAGLVPRISFTAAYWKLWRKMLYLQYRCAGTVAYLLLPLPASMAAHGYNIGIFNFQKVAL